jgi:cobalt-zinc-cadmium efflux system protein
VGAVSDRTEGAEAGRSRQRRALGWSIVVTTIVMVVEIAGGIWTGSLMLLSDAAHMGSHSVALLLSWGALRLGVASLGNRSHFGLYRAEVLAAFLNGLGVLGFTGWIGIEAVDRWRNPVPVLGGELLAIAVLGLATNIATAWLLVSGGSRDINTRSALVHVLGDLLSSVAIVLGAAVLAWTGQAWIDIVLSVLVALLILVWGVNLLREATEMLLELSPAGLDLDEVRRAVLERVPEVSDVHDLHVWDITSGYRCATAHVVVEEQALSATEPTREAVARLLGERFGVAHATLQLETRR